jgi:hypothetical protein
MGSTEGEAGGGSPEPAGERSIESAALQLFDEVLVPLAAQLRAADTSLADVAPRRAAESFYEPVRAFARADFEIVAGGDPETLRAALLQQWKDEPALHPLAEHLARLSGEIGVEREQSAEVSPFLYVMF